MQNIKHLAVLAAVSLAASGNGAAVDLVDFQGLGKFVLNSGAATGNANATADFKIQHSADGATGWADAGIAFAQVTNPGGASAQDIMVNVDRLKRYVRVVTTLGGTTPAVVASVSFIGKKQSS